MCVGFSAGASVLLRTLGRVNGFCSKYVRKCLLICPNFDWTIRGRFWSVFDKKLLTPACKAYLERHQVALELTSEEINSIRESTCVDELNDVFSCPRLGYVNSMNYFTDADPLRYVHSVYTPTLIVSADDDPVCPVEGVLHFRQHMNADSYREYFQKNNISPVQGSGLVQVLIRGGGHGPFMPFRSFTRSWMDELMIEWLSFSSSSISNTPNPSASLVTYQETL
jgi:predicted alpha/beta-fold hydrolase